VRRTGTVVSPKVEQFGKYTILRRIASGGMASVFLGRERMEGGEERWVAIKRVHPHLISRKDVVQMFLNEAKLLARLDHENITGIIDFGVESESPYIVMRYLFGVALSGFIRRLIDRKQPLPIDMMAHVAASICDGLHYAHEAHSESGEPLGLVHRDISPQNIFITFDGAVSLLDFGVAKAAGFTGFTRTGHIKGKYAYMSPEQVAANPLDRRSDIFSLGIVLWESLTGRHLFRRKQHIETLRSIARAEVPPVSEYNADVPPTLEAIVARALVADRRHRYQTARAMGADLWSYLLQQDPRVGVEQVAAVMKACYPEMKHPSLVDGFEETHRLEIAPSEPRETPVAAELISDPSMPLDDPALMSIPDAPPVPIGALDGAVPIVTQPDAVRLQRGDNLEGTLRTYETHQVSDSGLFGEKTIAMGSVEHDGLVPPDLNGPPMHPELTPSDTFAAPAIGVETTRRTAIEFEDGTEVQLMNPTARTPRSTDATLRDGPLDPSERQRIERALRSTRPASTGGSGEEEPEEGRGSSPRLDPPYLRAHDEKPRAPEPKIVPLSPDAAAKLRFAPSRSASPTAQPPPHDPILPPARGRRSIWELALVLIAAVSIGALVYTAVLRYVSERQRPVIIPEDPKP
jgi:eukaryotic-like serine/threonine-protein kinase